MYKLKNSEVKHYSVLDDTSYTEGRDNKAQGYFNDSVWFVRYTNSHNNPNAFAGGKCARLGNIIFAWGKAYGYENHPEGRNVAGFVFINDEKKTLSLTIPASVKQLIKIKIQFEEYNAVH